MTTKEVFENNLLLLKKLFPNQINLNTEAQLIKELRRTERIWLNNKKRYKNKEIKYLLIGEAPPFSGKYFYSSTKNDLFKRVWEVFFSSSICAKKEDAYQCLANEGFLLVDSIPYHMNYSQSGKRNSPYNSLISYSLCWWRDNLNKHFSFHKDLKIAFAFEKNGNEIIKASGGNITIGGEIRKLNVNQIAVNKAHYTSPVELVRVFKLRKLGKSKCNCQTHDIIQ